MQNIVIAEPYRFVPPFTGNIWGIWLRRWLPRRVRKRWGVEWPTFHGLERVKASIAAGHGVILAPNHCRPSDPEVVGLMCIALNRPCYIMASWHLFKQNTIQTWMLRAGGAFSVWREGLDRESLKAATHFLTEAYRPLILFPEGIVSRSNDRLGTLMDGTAFIARSAAKARAKADRPGKVVIHPVFLRYHFGGDLRDAVTPVLARIEERIGWQPQSDLKIVERVTKLGEALLSSKEVEYFGKPQAGEIRDRLPRLIDRVLGPIEAEYLNGRTDPSTIERVKKLRTSIVPGLITGELAPADAARRWRQLADCYFAQQLACYPIDYLKEKATVERILETVERYEEDLTDDSEIHRPLRVTITAGDAIEVGPDRPRGGTGDPLMRELEDRLAEMLAQSTNESQPWTE